MTPLSGIVMAFGVAVLLAALLFRKQMEKAGAPLIVPLAAAVLAAAAVAAYSNHRAQLKQLNRRKQCIDEDPDAPRDGGGGMGNWRERFAYRLALTSLVRKLPVLDQQEGLALSAEQAAKLIQTLAPLRTEAKLAKEPALALVAKAKAVLTPEQIAGFDAIELPRLSRGRGRRGRPDGAATQTASPAATTTAATTETARPAHREAGSGTRERQEGRRRRFDPDANPFMRERYKPMLDALLSLLEKRAGKAGQERAPAAKPVEG